MYWLDYSAAKLSGTTIRSAGYTGVIRYIDAPQLLSTKHTNLDEYRSHLAADLIVRLVHQGTNQDADSGFQGGVNRATRAKAGADYLGYTGVIYFTNDRPTVADVAAWQSYLDGAASVLGRARVGAYGFYNALNAAVGHASAFWQAGRRSDLVAHANFWQDNNVQVTVGGITCDRNLVLTDYVPNSQNGFLMSLTPDQEQFIFNKVHDIDATLGEVYKATGGKQTFGQNYVELSNKVNWLYSVLGNTPDVNGDGKKGDVSLVDFRQFLVDKLVEIDSQLKAQAKP